MNPLDTRKRWLVTLVCSTALLSVLAQAPPAYRDLPPADTAFAKTNAAALPDGGLGDFNAQWYALSALNAGLGPAPDTFHRITPQETLENFIRACRAGRFATAAHALNLNLLPEGQHAERGPVLAQQLYYVLDQRIGLPYGSAPDRPDGAVTVPKPSVGQVGTARRSVSVGDLSTGDYDVSLRLQRVRVGSRAPHWVWAATTVEEVPALYANYGPGWLEQHVPTWSKRRFLGLPLWTLLGIALALLLCWGFGWLVYRGLQWACEATSFEWANVLGERLAKPFGSAVGILAFYFVLRNVLSISGPAAKGFFIVLLVIVVAVIIWVASRAIDYVIEFFVERDLADISDEANDQARSRMTTLSVARRVIVFVLLAIGVSIVFSRISGLEAVGYALLSSAGFVAIVLGIAAQSTLGNLVAGVQIAVTRPIRIGDAVLYEGNWGELEDIRFTYLVIRTWDLRRVIVPLKYFIDHPFENWSITDSKLLKTFYIYADYRIDVNQVRDKFDELTRAHELYNDHKPPDFIVHGLEDGCIKMRGTVSAEDSSKAWTLHCDVREALNDYVRELEDGLYLPRERLKVVEGGAGDGRTARV